MLFTNLRSVRLMDCHPDLSAALLGKGVSPIPRQGFLCTWLVGSHCVRSAKIRPQGCISRQSSPSHPQGTASVGLGSSLFRHGQSIVRHGSSIVRHGSSIVRHGQSIVCHGSSIVRQGQSIVRRGSSIVRRPNGLIRAQNAGFHPARDGFCPPGGLFRPHPARLRPGRDPIGSAAAASAYAFNPQPN